MPYFLLSSFSLMALIVMFTAGLFIVSLNRLPEKAAYKKWLIIFYSGLFIWHSMGFLSGGFHSGIRELTYRYSNTIFNIGLAVTGVSIIQIAYLFPEATFNKERNWVLYITTGLSFIFISLLIWFHFIQNQQGLSSKTYSVFVNPLAGMFGLITTLWAAVIYVRKALYFHRYQSHNVVPARLLFLCTIGMFIISGFFIYPGAQTSWVIPTYTYGMWILIQTEALIFIIYSAFPIRFRPKLVGFVFASIMAILSVATMLLVPFTTNSEAPSNIAQRLFDQPLLIRLLIIILGSALFVLLIFPVILKVSLIKPLEQLMMGIRQADKGDLSVQVPHGMLDEIGIATRNFNTMVQSLKQSKDALTNYANTLEGQVQERTTELRKSLTNLQNTQSQLAHAEKMASLGELTAGIAHEIQNPLNFINNFSEVSVELLQELQEELAKGNTAEIIALAKDLVQNLHKITQHGKRADAIVKGMLLHSRTNTGKKELTDINALVDEFLRLSYHGMRAKNVNFNAATETNFAADTGKVNIVAQDIGRVLLNLFNNAFYAVGKKKQSAAAGYEPTITVSTKRDGNCVIITLHDNGNGIPQEVLDKMYQPFFTTKPTGEGTGLGLSISYDIITKTHGGTIEAKTTEGRFAEFIISLPVS